MRSKRLEFQGARPSTTNNYRKYSVDERYNASVFLLRNIGRQQQNHVPAIVNDRRVKENVTDAAVGEKLNVAALEKQKLLKIKPGVAYISGQRAKEIVTDAGVGERLNTVAIKKQSLSAKRPRISFVNGQRANETVTNAVDERLSSVAVEKQRSSATKFCSEIVDGSSPNEIVNIAVDARLNSVALKKQCSSTTPPTNPVVEKHHAVADLLDAGSDIDTWSVVRDEDAHILHSDENDDFQIAEEQLLPTDSDEDADIIDGDGHSEVQFLQDQLLPSRSDGDANSLDADGNTDVHILLDQLRKRRHDEVRRQAINPHSESNNTNCTNNGQGSTTRPSGTRKLIIFDLYGRPCDVGSEEFASYIGKIVRARCPPAIDDWRIVPLSMKEDIWKNIVAKYVVPEVYKPNVLQRASKSWRNWKSLLRAEMDKYETIDDRKINMPERFITNREDWERFVDFCDTDEDRKRRATGKKLREATEFLHSTGRKGIYRKIYDWGKENPTGEVNRSAIFLDTHVSKTINDPDSSSMSDIKMRLIKELVEANPDGQKDIDNDAVAQVCGRDSRGLVSGMGGGVTRSKVRASATVVETLRQVQQENKRLQSDILSLLAQIGKEPQNHTSTPSIQSAPHMPDGTSTPSNQSASQAPVASDLPARSRLASPSSSRLAPESLPARLRLAPDVSNMPAHSHAAPPASNLPAHSRLAPNVSSFSAHSRVSPPASNLPASSCWAPPATNFRGSSCFIKSFKGRTIALGSFDTAEPPTEHVYSLIIEDIFDRDAELFDKDGKLGDIMIGGLINWPKACVVANLPADSCFIRNFKRRTIAFGSFSASADPQMEHVYRVVVKEIYDRDAELFDTDGKLGDIMAGGIINWPKACIKPCQQ